jgi:hypothetical protein
MRSQDRDRDGTVSANSACDVLHKIFTAALLLTGSAARAERAVVEAIETLMDHVSASSIFQATIRIAVSPQIIGGAELSGEQELPASWLPLELQRVLLLPRDDRHAFVLRLLLGLSRNQCSRLLHVEDGELDKRIVSAALALASIKTNENRDVGTIGAVA